MNPPPDSPRPPDPISSLEVIETAAAAWLSLRDRGMSVAETTEFVRWLQQDPQHAAVFAELDAVWKDFDRLSTVPAPAAVTASPDADMLAPRVRLRHRRTFLWSALGAAAGLVLAFFLFPDSRAPRHTAETAVGAFQQLDLPDGSVAQLNTNSALDVAFTASERRVTIARGEVFFTVTKDPARPFIVTSGLVAIRAVGTAFNVRRHDGAVEVLVTEGRVRIDDARLGSSLLPAAAAISDPRSPSPDRAPGELAAGERAFIPATATTVAIATVEDVSAPAAQRTLAWQERRLEFDSASLAEVVREFNRYNRRQLVIAAPDLAAKRFSGTFRADGYESLVSLLENEYAVIATRGEREIVLRTAR